MLRRVMRENARCFFHNAGSSDLADFHFRMVERRYADR
jgi:hypothetical protein